MALKHNLPIYQPEKIRGELAQEMIQKTEADVIVVVAFGQIIPKTILEMKRYGCINVHASLLPKYRGAAPIQWAVINGEKESGVTIMQMDAGLDTGDMLLKGVVELDKKETGGSLFDRLSSLGASLCIEALEKLERGELVPKKQGKSPTAYAGMLKKEMGCIDWTKSAVEIERLIRGLNPWPSAYTFLEGKNLKIWSAEVLEEIRNTAVPGSVIEVTRDAFCVACGQGALKITELQLQGKKRMDTAAFLRGNSMEKGALLGAKAL